MREKGKAEKEGIKKQKTVMLAQNFKKQTEVVKWIQKHREHWNTSS